MIKILEDSIMITWKLPQKFYSDSNFETACTNFPVKKGIRKWRFTGYHRFINNTEKWKHSKCPEIEDG